MTVAVFGCGLAGLTAAHELVRCGHQVTAYEAGPEAGGFYRSGRSDGMPTEYSWHGMGPWYHNTFAVMRQIPFDEQGTVYDRALSRPIDFGIFPDDAPAQFYDRGPRSIPRMFRMNGWEFAKWAWLMLKTWASHERTETRYAAQNAAERWSRLLGRQAGETWRACLGPWIGSDWCNCSLHTAGQFFRKQLMTQPTHYHRADEDGPAWTHGAGDGWLLLRGPSSEFWFRPWVRHLEEQGVDFHFRAPLHRLEGRSALLEDGTRVEADHFVLALSPFEANRVVARSNLNDPELAKYSALVADGRHVQVSFRLAFGEPIRFPRERTAVVLADTEFNLTLFAQEQAWRPECVLGEGVRSLWTGTSCAATVPGRVHGLPVLECTRDQFIDEVLAQVRGCQALQEAVRAANGGRGIDDFPLLRVEVWHEWSFPPGGRQTHTKWVTTTNTQAHQPDQVTSLPHLRLAGSHTRTEADVWSIEGAVESGRRAARSLDPRVEVVPQYKAWWLRALGRFDDAAWRLRLPHVLDLALGAAIISGCIFLSGC